MKNQQGFVWAPLLIIIGAVVVAGFATYFLIQNNNVSKSENVNIAVVNQVTNINGISNTNSATNTNQMSNSNVSTSTNTTTNTNAVSNTNTTTDPTAGWKTYTNSNFGYSIRYPSDWPFEENHSSIKSTITIGNIPAEPSAGPFTVYVKKNDSNLRAFLDSYKQGFPDGCGAEGTKTVGGVTWTRLDCKGAFAGETHQNYALTRSGSIYHIYYVEGSAEINTTFERIFSTFTFID